MLKILNLWKSINCKVSTFCRCSWTSYDCCIPVQMEVSRDDAEEFTKGGTQHVIDQAMKVYNAEGWTPARKALTTTVRCAIISSAAYVLTLIDFLLLQRVVHAWLHRSRCGHHSHRCRSILLSCHVDSRVGAKYVADFHN